MTAAQFKPAEKGVRRAPIAIIGAACRLPGAPDLKAFWDVLFNGRDVIGKIPPERFDIDPWYDPTPETSGRIVSREGGFLEDIEMFDARFFGISPREAVRLDPQNRLLIEIAWEALEDAGIPADRVAGSRTGVYAGCLTSSYWELIRRADVFDLHAAATVGGSGSAAAGRISYLLDLHGPSMGVEAHCAASLMALHLACRALWSGEIELAIAGGANLLLTPDDYLALSEAGILSPTGRCRFGDARADGYVRSEGAVTVILKPLAQAVADGDRVYATILGTAAVNLGRGAGTFMTPGVDGQVELLRLAYRDAGVAPGDLDYIEAHGTGTSIGDGAELAALSQVLGEGRPPGRRCLVGSVKSNIGHTEVAAGLAGLLKTALAMKNCVIPATLHLETPNPLLEADDVPLELVTGTRPWPRRDRPVLAGISSFGLVGTIVHVVLAEAPEPSPPRGPSPRRYPLRGQPPPRHPLQPHPLQPHPLQPHPLQPHPLQPHPLQRHQFGPNQLQWHSVRRRPPGPHSAPPPLVLPVSARSPAALCALAGEYADVVEAAVDTDRVVDTCFSAGARRSHHTYRAAVIGADREVLADGLRSAAAGSPAPSVVAAAGLSTGPPRTVFVFPGQGAQWVGMGRELLAVNESFADRLRECDDAIEAELGWSLIDRLHDDDPFTMVDEIQPALWAMQVSIAQVWRDWGVEPGLVIGHSMGEIAAAVTAGALTVRQGASVVCRRSSLLRDLRGLGSMWAVQLGEEAARAAIGEFADRVCVGVVNSDHSTVLSGDPDLLAEIVAPLEERGVFCRRVHVDYASHAPQVEAIRHRMLDALSGLRPRRGRLPLYSTVLERIVDGAEMDGGYWTANLRQVVRFASGVRHALSGGGHTLFVEVSPHPLLVSAIEDGIEATGAEATVIPSLHRDRPEPESLLAGLGMAYVHGCAPDWRRIYPDGRFVPVPGHPWQRKRHWIDSLDAVADNAVADNAVAGNGAAGNVAAEPSSDATARPAPAERHGSGPPPESELVLARRVVDHASDVLAMTPGEIDQNAPLTLAGLDSLLAAKLRTRLAAELGVQVSVRELLSARSPRELADGLSERIRLMHGHRETHGA